MTKRRRRRPQKCSPATFYHAGSVRRAQRGSEKRMGINPFILFRAFLNCSRVFSDVLKSCAPRREREFVVAARRFLRRWCVRRGARGDKRKREKSVCGWVCVQLSTTLLSARESKKGEIKLSLKKVQKCS
jgi:hypothetical protein